MSSLRTRRIFRGCEYGTGGFPVPEMDDVAAPPLLHLPIMKYRRLGKTNLRVSVIGIGTWQFGGEWGKNFTQVEVDAIFDAAREAGLNLIDTAECYGDHTSESFIGNSIARDRDKWIVATKF